MAFPGSELIESGPGPNTISSHRLHSHQSASEKLLPLIYGFSLSLIRTRDLLLSAITLSESAERQKPRKARDEHLASLRHLPGPTALPRVWASEFRN